MANEVWITTGTTQKFNGEANANVAFSVQGIANAAGRVSEQFDIGAAPRPYRFKWAATAQFQATPTQGGMLELYVAAAPDHSAALIDGNVGAVNAALGNADMRRNLRYIGSIVVETATANKVFTASGEFVHTHRYLSLVAYNAAGSAVHATDANFAFHLQPISDQGQ